MAISDCFIVCLSEAKIKIVSIPLLMFFYVWAIRAEIICKHFIEQIPR